MKLRIGYYPMLDITLALRQLCCPERFQPFSPHMEAAMDKLPAEERSNIEQFAGPTDEWLAVMENLLEMAVCGISGPEETVLKLDENPQGFIKTVSATDNAKLIALLADLWSNTFNHEIARSGKVLYEKSREISKSIAEVGLLEFLVRLSDRVEKLDYHSLKYKIKPEHFIDFDKAATVLVMPSLFASRTLTFWHKDNNYIFYVSVEAAKNAGPEPSDMMLMAALALNDRTRLKMLRLLSGNNYSATEISELLDMNASTISRHFKLFKDANFIDIFLQQGNTVYYTLKHEEIRKAVDSIINYIKGDKNENQKS